MANPKWLKVAAQRSGQHTWTLGYIFEQYRKHEGKSAEELAADLDCSLEMLDWLSLCRRPDEERFAEHLGMIEKRFAVEPYRLAAVLRRVEVLDVLPASQEGGEAMGEDAFLLAARDHSTDDETSS
ncbi:hypothetical protein [Archangium sp.]|uniref:hypothetical protein n=1 Tax=Archangium sp. TaxID=1872627 RepID=UPI002D6A8382|nr:hypothetical protein [Archangium sp.]HYO53213.1 hypothetical protein [Archangium sp.]